MTDAIVELREKFREELQDGVALLDRPHNRT